MKTASVSGPAPNRGGRERILDLVLVPLFILAGGVLALRLEGDLARRLEYPDSPYATPSRNSEAATPSTERVVWVLADGIAPDRAAPEPTPHLRALAAEGRVVELTLPAPPDALPAFLSMVSGADRSIHGVAAEFCRPAPDLLVRLDNALLALARTGRRARLFAMPSAMEGGWSVVAPVVDVVPCDGGDEAATFVRGQRGESRRRLEIVRLPGSDPCDAGIGAIREALDLERETIIVTLVGATGATRGAAIVAGRGIRGGGPDATRGDAADVAPTLAVLLGLPFPAANGGTPLWEALDTSDGVRERREESLARQKDGFRKSCEARFALADSDEGEGGTDRSDAAGSVSWIVASRVRQYRAVVGPRIGLGVVIAAVLLLLAPRVRRIAVVGAGAAVGTALIAAVLAIRGAAFDVTQITARGGYAGFTGGFLALGAVAGLAFATGAGVLGREGGSSGVTVSLRRASLVVFGAVLVLWGIATVAWMRFAMPSSGTPELNHWTLVYAAALLLVASISFGGVPGAVLAAARVRFRRAR